MLQPGQVKNDREICIRYYCWNNELRDEVLIGCTPLNGKASAAAGAHVAGSGIGVGGPFMGTGSVSGMAEADANAVFTGPSITSIFKTDDGRARSVSLDASASTITEAKASADATNDLSLMQTKNEDNGIITEHVIVGSGLNFNSAANAFTGIAGYTSKEKAAIKAHGSTAVSADGSVDLFHDAMTIIHSTEGDEHNNLIAKMESKQEATANAAAEVASKLSAAIVDEGALCVDESGRERNFGEAWIYTSDACEICTCFDSGQVRCTKKECDPYPTCPEGHYVVEEKADNCCMTYRIVKDDCDISLCMHKAPKCSFYETLHTYAIDDCCATYECVCNPASCPDLGDPACPDGSVRVIVDSNQCCKVGKCVDMKVNALASSNSLAEVTAGEITVVSDTIGDKGSSISGLLKASAAAGAAAEAKAVQEAAVTLQNEEKATNYIQTIFDAGKLSLGTGSEARALGAYGMGYGYPMDMGHISAGAFADSGVSFQGGHFETIIKTGGKTKAGVHVKAKSDNAAKGDAAATGSQAADVFVDGGEHGGSMTKAVFVPGKIAAGADADAQLAGEFGGYGMPGHYMGHLAGKAAAQSDLSYQGGHVMITHFDDSGKGGDVKAALKSDLDAEAQAEVAGAQDAYIAVDGGKKGGSEFTTIFHPGQLSGGAKSDASVRGDIINPYGYLGGSINQFVGADANANAAVIGDSFATTIVSTHGSSDEVNINVKNTQTAAAKSDAKGSSFALQIADEANLCIDENGIERKFGDCWHQSNDPCKLCSCVDKDTVECKQQECDPYPPEIAGKLIVEEKTGDCCYSYRYVSSECDIFSCQYQPVICSPFEKMVSYAIDECCSTYECVCDEAKCFNPGNPACPEGSTRMVVDQDACCGVGKCVYVDASAAANAKAEASIKNGFLSIISTENDGKESLIDASLFSNIDASATSKAVGTTDTSIAAKRLSKKGSTVITKYVPGQVSVGSSALTQATSNLGWMGHGDSGGWKALADANANSALHVGGPEIFITSETVPSGTKDLNLNMLSNAEAKARADAAGKSSITGEIINDEGTCVDSLGKSRCYGEQWCAENDACIVCTCHDIDQINCVKQSCDPAPMPPKGYKVVEERNGGCCSTYRVVRETCDNALCQYSAPKCDLNEILKTYPLDKCCATYECVCNQASCPTLATLPCPDGCSRTIVDPHACCPVAKCVRGFSVAGGARSLVEANGMFGIFTETKTGFSPDTSKLSISTKSDAAADASANASGTSLLKADGYSKGADSTTTIVHLGGSNLDTWTGASALASHQHGFGGYIPGSLSGKTSAKADSKATIQGSGFMQTITSSSEQLGKTEVNLSQEQNANADANAKSSMDSGLEIVTEDAMCTDESGVERYYGETWYENGDACSLCTCSGKNSHKCTIKVCDPYPTAPEGHAVVEEKADDCCYSYRIIKETCDLSLCKEFAPVCNHYEDLVSYKVDECCATYECSCNPSKCPVLENTPCPKGCVRQVVESNTCCSIGKCVRITLHGEANAKSQLDFNTGGFVSTFYSNSGNDDILSGSTASNTKGKTSTGAETMQESTLHLSDNNSLDNSMTAIYKSADIALGTDANAAVAAEYSMPGQMPFGIGHAMSTANTNTGLSITGGHFEMISTTSTKKEPKIGYTAKKDIAAASGAALAANQQSDLLVSQDGLKDTTSTMVFVPGKIAAGADADAQLAGEFGGYGMPGHYMGHLAGKAAAQSDLSYKGGHVMITHFDDSGKGGDVKAALKSDLDAEAQAEVAGAQDAYIAVDGGKKGGSEFTTIFHPGQLSGGAKADAHLAGQYGLYDGYYGGKGHLDGSARAASDLALDGGYFEFISKTGGEGGSQVDFASKSDVAAKGDAAATGSQAADVFVDGGEHGGSMTKAVFVPGKIAAGADANAQLAGEFGGYGMPGHYMGHLAGRAAADSGVSFKPGHIEIVQINDGESSSSIDIGLSSDAAGKASVATKSGLDVVIEADICIDVQGRDHAYGETWLDETDKCISCTCVDVDNIK